MQEIRRLMGEIEKVLDGMDRKSAEYGLAINELDEWVEFLVDDDDDSADEAEWEDDE